LQTQLWDELCGCQCREAEAGHFLGGH
jgi:hypothetical protein